MNGNIQEIRYLMYLGCAIVAIVTLGANLWYRKIRNLYLAVILVIAVGVFYQNEYGRFWHENFIHIFNILFSSSSYLTYKKYCLGVKR